MISLRHVQFLVIIQASLSVERRGGDDDGNLVYIEKRAGKTWLQLEISLIRRHLIKTRMSADGGPTGENREQKNKKEGPRLTGAPFRFLDSPDHLDDWNTQIQIFRRPPYWSQICKPSSVSRLGSDFMTSLLQEMVELFNPEFSFRSTFPLFPVFCFSSCHPHLCSSGKPRAGLGVLSH